MRPLAETEMAGRHTERRIALPSLPGASAQGLESDAQLLSGMWCSCADGQLGCMPPDGAVVERGFKGNFLRGQRRGEGEQKEKKGEAQGREVLKFNLSLGVSNIR